MNYFHIHGPRIESIFNSTISRYSREIVENSSNVDEILDCIRALVLREVDSHTGNDVAFVAECLVTTTLNFDLKRFTARDDIQKIVRCMEGLLMTLNVETCERVLREVVDVSTAYPFREITDEAWDEEVFRWIVRIRQRNGRVLASWWNNYVSKIFGMYLLDLLEFEQGHGLARAVLETGIRPVKPARACRLSAKMIAICHEFRVEMQ